MRANTSLASGEPLALRHQFSSCSGIVAIVFRLSEEIRKQTALGDRLLRMQPVLIGSVRFPLRRSATRTVEAAHGPAPHGRSLAAFARAFRGCRAPRRVLEGILLFHEVGPAFPGGAGLTYGLRAGRQAWLGSAPFSMPFTTASMNVHSTPFRRRVGELSDKPFHKVRFGGCERLH
jgi:hypothetical protein